MLYLIAAILITLSALFSGLTLGLLSLETGALKRQAELGNKHAAKIYPLRRRGNLLLTTLLLGNVAVNTALALVLDSIAGGLAAGFIATALIFIFGEILPQAFVSRNALKVGAFTAPLVRLIMAVLYPITYPIALFLDWLLGHETPTVHSKRELMKIISEHEDSNASAIDEDEERIVHGALQFSLKRVQDVMTPREKVLMFPTDLILDTKTRLDISTTAYSRFPIYQEDQDTIIGVMRVKEILGRDHDKTAGEICDTNFLRVKNTDSLDTVLRLMIDGRRHLGIVFDNIRFVGVVTLEDILEEVIQEEIIDEDDTVV